MNGVRFVNFARAAELHGEAMQAVMGRVLASGTYIGGPEVEAFEEAFAGYCGARFAIGVANGTEAIELVLLAWDIGRGDDVVVPANTAVQTALAVTHAGAHVVLADVEPDTGLLSAATLEAALTRDTRVVVPVHLYGHPVDMDAIVSVAARAGARVLEDAAHAHGAAYRGRRCGGLSDAASFSFYPTKTLGAIGDGGCITTNDASLAGELRLLRACGLTSAYRHERHGRTSRLDPLQAAILTWKLEHLDHWNARRRELALQYSEGLAGLGGVVAPVVRAWALPAWYAYAVLVRGGRRDAVAARLAELGVETNVHYRVPMHLQPCYPGLGRTGDFPVSEARAGELLSLPLDPFHTSEEIAYVIDCVGEALVRAA